MENKLNELEVRKAEIEKTFEEKQQYLQALDKDIALMEALMSAKTERAKTANELHTMQSEYRNIQMAIAEASKPVENEAEAKE